MHYYLYFLQTNIPDNKYKTVETYNPLCFTPRVDSVILIRRINSVHPCTHACKAGLWCIYKYENLSIAIPASFAQTSQTVCHSQRYKALPQLAFSIAINFVYVHIKIDMYRCHSYFSIYSTLHKVWTPAKISWLTLQCMSFNKIQIELTKVLTCLRWYFNIHLKSWRHVRPYVIFRV